MKGGKREGAGRPKAPDSTLLCIRMQVDTHASIMALGGSRWAKRVLTEALDNLNSTNTLTNRGNK